MSTGNDERFFGFGKRFRKERERLGLTQKGLAARLLVTERSVIAYETDATPPKADRLILFEALGADVLYILTGEHSADTLSADEAALIDNYRSSSPQRKASLREVGAAFAESQLDIAADGTYPDSRHDSHKPD